MFVHSLSILHKIITVKYRLTRCLSKLGQDRNNLFGHLSFLKPWPTCLKSANRRLKWSTADYSVWEITKHLDVDSLTHPFLGRMRYCFSKDLCCELHRTTEWLHSLHNGQINCSTLASTSFFNEPFHFHSEVTSNWIKLEYCRKVLCLCSSEKLPDQLRPEVWKTNIFNFLFRPNPKTEIINKVATNSQLPTISWELRW